MLISSFCKTCLGQQYDYRTFRACPRCGACSTCCTCKECSHCSVFRDGRMRPQRKHRRHFCKVCKICRRRCQCLGTRQIVRESTSFGRRRATFEQNALRRTLGVEVEVSQLQFTPKYPSINHLTTIIPGVGEVWQTHRDSSVEGFGREFVSNPLQGDPFRASLKALYTRLGMCDFRTNASCGYHVHIGAHDLDLYDLRRVLYLYSKLEPFFYSLCRYDRAQSRYCAPLSTTHIGNIENLFEVNDPASVRSRVIEAVYYTNLQDIKAQDRRMKKKQKKLDTALKVFRGLPGAKDNHYFSARYRGLNLHTYFFRRTIEFRMKEGTTDFNEAYNWALLCGWFVEIAARLRDKEVLEIQNADDFLNLSLVRPYLPVPVELPLSIRRWVKKHAFSTVPLHRPEEETPIQVSRSVNEDDDNRPSDDYYESDSDGDESEDIEF